MCKTMPHKLMHDFPTLLYCRQRQIECRLFYSNLMNSSETASVYFFPHNILTSDEVYFVFAGHLTCVFGVLLFSVSGSWHKVWGWTTPAVPHHARGDTAERNGCNMMIFRTGYWQYPGEFLIMEGVLLNLSFGKWGHTKLNKGWMTLPTAL